MAPAAAPTAPVMTGPWPLLCLKLSPVGGWEDRGWPLPLYAGGFASPKGGLVLFPAGWDDDFSGSP